MRSITVLALFLVLIGVNSIEAAKKGAKTPPTPTVTEPANIVYKFPDTVVTATKFSTPIGQLTDPVQVITGEDLQNLGVVSVKDALNLLSNIQIVNSSGTQTLFMNGFDSNKYKFLVDGISLSDSTTPQGTPFLDSLIVGDIDRIEIISGSKGVIYGSNATAGVIQIITKKEANNKLRYDISFGEDKYFIKTGYGTTVGNTKIQFGFSQNYDNSASRLINTTEKDESKIQNYQFSASREFKKGRAIFQLQQNHSVIGLDNLPPNSSYVTQFVDDPNYKAIADQTLLGLGWTTKGKNSETRLNYSANFLNRASLNPTDNVDPISSDTTRYISTIHRVDMSKRINSVIFGLDGQIEQAQINGTYIDATYSNTSNLNKTQSTVGTFIQNTWRKNALSFTAGSRYELFEPNKSHFTYTTDLQYDFTATLKAGAGYQMGFREPTLFERFAPFFGNANLDTETTISRKVFIEKAFSKGQFRSTFFSNNIENRIGFVGSSYMNSSPNIQIDGMQYSYSYQPNESNQFRADYTHSQIIDTKVSPSPIKTPTDKWTLTSVHQIGKSILGLSMIHVGGRQDLNNSTFAVIKLAPYTLFNAKIQFPIDKELKGYVSVQNIGDVQYIETSDYTSPGRTILVGIQSNF